MPPDVQATFDWIDRDPTVCHTMNGPSEFRCIGDHGHDEDHGRDGDHGGDAAAEPH